MTEINVPGATQSPPVYVQVLRLLDKNKAYFAFLAPVLVALGTAAGSWVVTGEFSTNEIRIAAGGAIAGAISGIATYLAPAKAAVAKVPIDREAYPPGGGAL